MLRAPSSPKVFIVINFGVGMDEAKQVDTVYLYSVRSASSHYLHGGTYMDFMYQKTLPGSPSTATTSCVAKSVSKRRTATLNRMNCFK